MSIKISVETDACISCGTCADICPDVFYFDESSMKVKIREQYSISQDKIEEAIQSCPSQCISWDHKDVNTCETCSILCSDVFAFNENEEMAEVILPEGSIEDCLEGASKLCPEECIE